MILLIDNYDSFTYNLFQYLQELNCNVRVVYNNQITLAEIKKLQPSHIIISPGPGRPEQAGITIALIQEFYQQIPILGVCLGHQAIAAAFGGKVVFAPEIMHGKTSWIHHRRQGIFANIPQPFMAMRYHSLVVDKNALPSQFMITAWTENCSGSHDIMAIQHSRYPLVGVQFHPESIATESGHQLLQNFLEPVCLMVN